MIKKGTLFSGIIGGLCFGMAVASASLLPVHAAEEEDHTAGVQWAKKPTRKSALMRGRVWKRDGSWMQRAGGIRMKTEAGHREPGGRLTENGIILPVTAIGEKMPTRMRIR